MSILCNILKVWLLRVIPSINTALPADKLYTKFGFIPTKPDSGGMYIRILKLKKTSRITGCVS
ncbi:hypothetical protein ACV566_06185 [Staphylococcus aureus]